MLLSGFEKDCTSICDFLYLQRGVYNIKLEAIADNIEDEMIVKCDKKPVREQGKEILFGLF